MNEIVRIPIKERDKGEDVKEYYRNVKNMLGLPSEFAAYDIPPISNNSFFRYEGHVYSRHHKWDKFLHLVYSEERMPTVLCLCGSTSFHISMPCGEYSVMAQCASCGIEQEIYSG